MIAVLAPANPVSGNVRSKGSFMPRFAHAVEGGKMDVWRLTTHHEDPERSVDWTRRKSRIAIGWGGIGDIRQQGYTSTQDISRVIRDFYPGLPNSGPGGVCLYDFCYSMKKGDLVILSTGKKRVLVAEVSGGYEHKSRSEKPPIGNYQHQRKAQISERVVACSWCWSSAGVQHSVGTHKAWVA